MLHGELAWLESQLRPYRLIYLDSLICQSDFVKSGRSALLSGHPKSQELALIRAIMTNLKRETFDAERYGDDHYVGAKVKTDRALQARLSAAINGVVNDAKHRFRSAADLSDHLATLEKTADRPFTESLIVADAMLITRNRAPQHIRNSALFADAISTTGRQVECVLTDYAPDVLTLSDALISVVVDHKSFYAWNDDFTQIISSDAGWYPFVRTIGLYSTSPGGRPLINALALLIRPCPTPREFLSDYHTSRGAESFARTFVVLKERIEQLQNEAGKRAAALSPTKPSRIAFKAYRNYLYPVYFFVLLCRLNRLNADTLRQHSIASFTALGNYVMSLRGLAGFLDAQSQVLGPISSVDELLAPEPWVSKAFVPA